MKSLCPIVEYKHPSAEADEVDDDRHIPSQTPERPMYQSSDGKAPSYPAISLQLQDLCSD